MEQSPSWEANSRLANKKFPCYLWDPKVHDHVHKSPFMAGIRLDLRLCDGLMRKTLKLAQLLVQTGNAEFYR
jgi:hypothetical protein